MPSATQVKATRLSLPPVNLCNLSVFLDLDGVLAPLAPTPDAVGPTAERTRVLRELRVRLQERVAVISGRTLDEIDRITDGSACAASGIHGLERRRPDGSLLRAAADPALPVVIQALMDFAAEHPGVLVENKGLSAGLHYRQAPEAGASALALARQLAAETGLELQPGSMVLELKTPGSNKGLALSRFMTEAPFHDTLPIMVGDDLTDEYGFEAAQRLGGFGVLVGPERATAAQYRLEDVPAVLSWLDRLGHRA